MTFKVASGSKTFLKSVVGIQRLEQQTPYKWIKKPEEISTRGHQYVAALGKQEKNHIYVWTQEPLINDHSYLSLVFKDKILTHLFACFC